ncbi:MAG: acylphosphatase [Campylobacterota bacterium]|nr:acylphosphatase [Campylobacterota bacterium]
MRNYRFIISGRVQGVFYRKNIQENALKENFKGYVKNLPNGCVEACVSCSEEQLKKFIQILKEGSSNSIVEDIKKFECEESFENDFEIRY